ncbi:1-aminocyclopropane-1-carboxylate deaminase/D-cysteine desulfhydrase [Microbulbifer variabilis]|uniref:1-aminocyclopropane-1-carboxylate deaminase/D-cysteine desulfhydrase n=1 Tax=Microbulbifer variabilis TaxID=266805 RepID=UPI001CFF45CB|nr:pyridoxal-phosphate dependent enzyme [Microbulbifer variabilis]
MQPRLLDSLDLQAFTDAARNIPYQQLNSDLFHGLDVWVRRDDLIDPIISGNKAYKLFFNLIEAKKCGAKIIVTCGGAWSNHIHAVAAAGARFGFETIGIIRGERPPNLSATLQDAERFGMKLLFVPRALYRQRSELDFLRIIGLWGKDFYFIPEGGSNLPGIKGIQLLGKVIEETAPVGFDEVWVACGTGVTFAGLYSSIFSASVIGVEVLKAGDAIFKGVWHWIWQLSGGRYVYEQPIEGLLDASPEALRKNLLASYHCGGYGRVSRALIDFKLGFEGVNSSPPVDQVYMGKSVYALSKTLGSIARAEKKPVLLMHSGGLQGRRGYK